MAGTAPTTSTTTPNVHRVAILAANPIVSRTTPRTIIVAALAQRRHRALSCVASERLWPCRLPLRRSPQRRQSHFRSCLRVLDLLVHLAAAAISRRHRSGSVAVSYTHL